VNELPLGVLELLLSVSELLLSVLVDPESVFVSEVDEPDDEGLLLLSVLAMQNSFFLSVGGGSQLAPP